VSAGSAYGTGITPVCDENHNTDPGEKQLMTRPSYLAILLSMNGAGRVFKALADPTRRQILQELKAGELTAGEIVSRFSISGPSISRHLSILETAELVSERKEGNRIFYRLEPENIALGIGDFLSSVCPTQILARHQNRPKEDV
jgi:DNA-binding transcriptional ArsR family regulator